MATSDLVHCMERYLSRMLAGDWAGLAVANDAKITENGEAIAFGGGVLQSAHAIGFRQFTVDDTNQQVGFFGTLETSAGPAMLALRMKCEQGTITELEAIVPRPGGHALFAPQRLHAPLPIYAELLAAEQRAPRGQLIATANLYFDAIERADGRIAPCDPACNRRENGVETVHRPPHFPLGCRESINRFTYIPSVRNRRFPIVDEQRGLVWAQVIFDMPTQKRSLRLAELFKIAGGEIQAIEALMLNTTLGADSGWPDEVGTAPRSKQRD